MKDMEKADIYEERMEEMRKRLEKLKEKTISSKNFNDLKAAFWSVLNQSDVVIMDLEKLVMQAEENIEILIEKAEKLGLPTEGNHYYHALIETQKAIDFLKEDLDWRNFEFDIMKIWMDKLSIKVLEANELELHNIRLQTELDMKKEDRARIEQDLQRDREQKMHELELEKLRLQAIKVKDVKPKEVKDVIPAGMPLPPAAKRQAMEEDESKMTDEQRMAKKGIIYERYKMFFDAGKKVVDELFEKKEDIGYIKIKIDTIKVDDISINDLDQKTKDQISKDLHGYVDGKVRATFMATLMGR